MIILIVLFIAVVFISISCYVVDGVVEKYSHKKGPTKIYMERTVTQFKKV